MDDLAFAPLCVEMQGTQVKRVLCMGNELPNVQRLHAQWEHHRHCTGALEGKPSKLRISNRSGPITIVVGKCTHPRAEVTTTTEEPYDDLGPFILAEIQQRWVPNKPMHLLVPTNFKAWISITICIPESTPISIRTFSGNAQVWNPTNTCVELNTYCGQLHVDNAVGCQITTHMKGGLSLFTDLHACVTKISADQGLVRCERVHGTESTSVNTTMADILLMHSTTPWHVQSSSGDVVAKHCTLPLLSETRIHAHYVDMDQTNQRVLPNKFVFSGYRTAVCPTQTTPVIEEVS